AATGAALIVRLGWQSVPLQGPDGRALDLLATLRNLPEGARGDWAVQTAPTGEIPAVPGRLVAVRKSPAAAEAARGQGGATARRKGKTPDARSLEAADYLFVFTTVPADHLAGAAVLEVYRFRWQIELAFKRLKSLLSLDALVAKDPAFCRTFLCMKLLGALLVDQLSHRWVDFSPWGYGAPAPAVALAGLSGGGRDAAPSGGGGPHRRRLGSRHRRVGAALSRHPPAPAPQSSGSSHLLCPSAANP